LLVADTAQAIAEGVMSLLTDETQRHRVGQAGRQYVETNHNWNAAAEKLEVVYREVIAEASRAHSRQRKAPGE
jgi:glycosyltransferase involved in cell wall biosynthesis